MRDSIIGYCRRGSKKFPGRIYNVVPADELGDPNFQVHAIVMYLQGGGYFLFHPESMTVYSVVPLTSDNEEVHIWQGRMFPEVPLEEVCWKRVRRKSARATKKRVFETFSKLL